MDRRWKVVIASSHPDRRRSVGRILARLNIDPVCVTTVQDCREKLPTDNVGLVFCDRNLSDGNYKDLLAVAACRSSRAKTRVVLMSDLIEAEDYQSAKFSGAFGIVSASCHPTDIEWMVIQAKRDQWNCAKPLIGTLRRTSDRRLGTIFGH